MSTAALSRMFGEAMAQLRNGVSAVAISEQGIDVITEDAVTAVYIFDDGVELGVAPPTPRNAAHVRAANRFRSWRKRTRLP